MNKLILFLIMSFLFIGICAADSYTVDVKQITSTSTLPDSTSGDPNYYKKIRYSADKAFDGREDTVWSEGSKGPGINESITITFEKSIPIDKIGILTGFWDDKLFKANNRIKKFRIESDAGVVSSFFCQDGQVVQEFQFSKISTKKLKLTIIDVYKGDRWDDTCLSELQLFYKGTKYNLRFNRVNYNNGKYSLSLQKDDCTLLIKNSPQGDAAFYLTISGSSESKNVSGDLLPGHQVGASILSGNWTFYDGGTLILNYSYYAPEKRMGMEEEGDYAPPTEIEERLTLVVVGEIASDDNTWFGSGFDIMCIVKEKKIVGGGK